MSTNRDRSPTQLELTKAPWPVPPLNVFVKSAYRPGAFDISWDDPATQVLNSTFQLVGVNVYRSFDSEFGPFERLTELPIGATFWRDETNNELVVEEDVSASFLLRGESSAGQAGQRFVFRTLHYPIVKEASQATPANSPFDVHVYIDGVEAKVLRVHGETGEIEIDARYYVDVATQKQIAPLVPGDDSRVTCTYRYTKDLVKSGLAQRVFYRITTVGIPIGVNFAQVQSTDLVETPLENAAATHSFENEKLDFMWREAMRRNRWILEQGGERVKVFIRKNNGIPCTCSPDQHHKQPLSDCRLCFATGYLGGYEGPYDIIIAPDEAERRISQKESGRTVEHTYETWTGPSPLLSMRDFIVKINGERYSVGPVRMPNNRGNVMQQHFSVGHLDEKDIRYSVPVGDPVKYVATQMQPSGPEMSASSADTDKDNIPEERQLRGRTRAWENTEY